MMNIFNRKKPLVEFYGKCFFCSKALGKDYGSLAYEPESGDPVEYGRICESCAGKLEELELRRGFEDEVANSIDLEDDD